MRQGLQYKLVWDITFALTVKVIKGEIQNLEVYGIKVDKIELVLFSPDYFQQAFSLDVLKPAVQTVD